MKSSLEVDSVYLNFGKLSVLRGATLQCSTGHITGLLGRNGSGKSCLLKIINGELLPENSFVRLNDRHLLNRRRRSEDMHYLQQRYFIPRSFSPKKVFRDYNLDFSDFLYFFPEFRNKYHTPVGRISEGERRILEVYAVLASATRFSLLDEPFSMIMPLHVEIVKEIIKREKQNKGIIITDHLFRHVLELCNPLYVLSGGGTHIIKQPEDLVFYGYLRNEGQI